jgi:nicotinamide-nucleotide amidase
MRPEFGPDIDGLPERVGELLSDRGEMLATAESCTGGGIAQSITDVPGSSAWFDRGFVTYSNVAKTEMLGVDPGLIAEHGAVSEMVVRAMVAGALRLSQAGVSVAVSVIAGPSGGSADKPVGTVWFAWQRAGSDALVRCMVFSGDRRAVRRQAVALALEGLLAVCRE